MDIRARKRRVAWVISYLALWLTLGLSSAVRANTVTYVYTDPQGTPLAEANASGTITATFDYAPYGSQAMGAAHDGPGYTGHVNDADTGLVYMQARYYDPGVGRFLSVDPVSPTPGDFFSYNRYDYANNNPYTNIDPDGREVRYAGSDEYVAKVKADVAYGKKIEPGFAKRISQLENSKNVHTISDAKGADSPNNPFNSSVSDAINDSNDIGEGSDVYYDPNNNTQSNGYERPALAGLAHEISHSAETDSGTKGTQVNSKGQTPTENNAARAAGDMIKAIQKAPPEPAPTPGKQKL